MKFSQTLKRRIAVALLALVLATPVWAPASANLAARLTRGSTEPRAVAVNWNSGTSTIAATPESK